MKAFLVYGDKTEGPFTDPMEVQRRISELGKTHEHIELHRADIVCDFCSFPLVHWRFQIPAGDEVVMFSDEEHTEHHIDQDGLWGACDPCKDFIDKGDWPSMRERSVEHAYTMHTMMEQMPRPLVALSVTNAHMFFRERWEALGKPEPVATEADEDFLATVGIQPLH
jgi:hypothetical protein